MEAYNYKFLALGMICPEAPGLKYSAYMLTVLISKIPILILTGFVSYRFVYSYYDLNGEKMERPEAKAAKPL
ncbi:hypothetical protein [Bacillus amyloliquefaciens]|uniref:hypothetical protein n=1 Tax=Bacillus amyloliquefaciens TaxID=1390 RepID=UPI003A84980C